MKRNDTPQSLLEKYRVLFGIAICIQSIYFFSIDFVELDIKRSLLYFSYPYLSFVKPYSSNFGYILLALSFLSSIMIIFNKFTKISYILYFLSFTYFWLIDMSYFNNHYYLISLIALVFIFKSFDSPKIGTTSHYEFWLIVFRYLWLMVFFIAGLNKINCFWLKDFEPMKSILAVKASVTNNDIWNSELVAMIFSYGGLITDIGVVYLLLSKKWKILGFILLLIFNVTNFFFFYDIGEIGIFPLLILFSLILFLDVNVSTLNKKFVSQFSSTSIQKKIIVGILIFVSIIPFRHYLIEGHVDWTGEGRRFSWRMKIVQKEFDFKCFVQEEGSSEKYEIPLNEMLTTKQLSTLAYYPELIPILKDYILIQLESQGFDKPLIYLDYYIGMNGCNKKYGIDNSIPINNLTTNHWRHDKWILSFDNCCKG